MEKEKYLKKYNYVKRRKLFILLIVLFSVSILLGFFYFLLGSKSNKSLTMDYYSNFFTAINSSKLNYLDCIINSISSNVLETVLLFLLSISIIGVFFVFLLFVFHSFTLGYVVSSFISIYKLNGLVPLIIYIVPLLIRLFLLFVLTFYSFNFASRFYNYLIRRKDVDVKSYFRRYLKIFLFILMFFVINSLIESIIVPALLKAFTKSLI